jgi:anaerobic C4-dicarboxylate transporter
MSMGYFLNGPHVGYKTEQLIITAVSETKHLTTSMVDGHPWRLIVILFFKNHLSHSCAESASRLHNPHL